MDNSKQQANTPCLKHAVSNLAEKSIDFSSDVPFCSNCSKTMLSYIFLIQNVLDNLARSIDGREVSQLSCVQCLRQEIQDKSTRNMAVGIDEAEKENNGNSENGDFKQLSNQETMKQNILCEKQTVRSETNLTKKPTSRRNSRRFSKDKNLNKINVLQSTDLCNGNQDWKIDFLYSVAPLAISTHLTGKSGYEFKKPVIIQKEISEQFIIDESRRKIKSDRNEIANSKSFFKSPSRKINGETMLENKVISLEESPDAIINFSEESQKSDEGIKNSVNQHFYEKDYYYINGKELSSGTNNFDKGKVQIPVVDSFNAISKENNKILDQSLIHLKPLPEAFVTVCRNNSEALGCLVLGSSLLLSRSSKVLCVLVSDEVHVKLRELLSSFFHVVHNVDSLEPSETCIQSRLCEKSKIFNVWRLVEFSKCVFLNPDTLVLRNCDELFDFSELSAVPDNGWPDCFNSGVFVFQPSLATFSLMNEKQGMREYCEAGDHIFLNLFFNSWAQDMSKKLPFIYNLNLVGAETYTYAAAFQRFGQNVKIVQFSGSPKPWDMKFSSESNQLTESSNIPMTSVRFVHEWLNNFRLAVVPLLPKEVYSLIFNQKSISAQEILNSFSLPESFKDVESRSFIHNMEANRSNTNYSKVNYPSSDTSDDNFLTKTSAKRNSKSPTNHQILRNEIYNYTKIGSSTGDEELHNCFPILKENVPFSSLTCRSNYDGMKMWEEGKMDYEGIDNSESIIKRLELLIQ